MVSVGSATFELIGDDSQLAAAFVQAQAKAQQANTAIQAAVKAQTAAIQAGSTAQAGALQQVSAQQALVAQSAAAMAAQAQQRYAQMAQAAQQAATQVTQASTSTQQANTNFTALGKSALELGVAFAGVSLGAEGIRKAFDAVIDSTLKAQQANRTITAAYGDSAPQMRKFADDLAASLGKTNTEVETGVARMAILQKQYGITSDEIQKLTKVSLDLGAAFGDSDEAIRSVQAAIRGEPEALEKYGIALQVNAIQNNDLLTESEKKNFQSLDAVTQARIRYRIILAESAQYEGEAAKRAGEAAGQFDKAARSTDELGKAIGASLLPGLGRIASGWADATNALAAYIAKSKEAELDAEQMGIPSALARAGLDPATGKPPVAGPAAFQGPLLGPSPADVKAINAQIEAETRRSEDEQAQIIIDGLKKIHDERAKDLDDQKKLAEIAERNQLDSLSKQQKAAVDAIHDQAEAAAEASRVKIAQLQEEEQQQRDVVEQEKQDTLDGIAVAKRAADDAADDQVKHLEARQHAEEDAAKDRHDQLISDLDVEKRLRDDARILEDRRLQDEVESVKRAEDARHQAVTRELDDEVKAANDAKDKKIRAIAEEAKANQDKHDKKAKELQDEADQDRRIHDATLATIEGEAKAAQLAHDQTEKTLQAELDAATKAHDASAARIQAETEAASTAHDARLRALADEGNAAQVNRDRVVRGLEDEARHAQDTHDKAIRGIEQEANAEDNRHRAALSAIDSETRAKQDALDAQIRGLDNLDKASQNASTIQGLQDRVASAQTGVAKARDTGNQSTIDEANRQLLAAQQALADGQTKIARDAQRQQLQDQKSALTEAAAAQKVAEDEKNRQIKAGIDAQKQAADDELARIKRSVDARKQAADDELKQIQTRLAAEKQAEDDDYARIQATLKAEKEAADAALKLVQEHVAAGKLAATELLAQTKERLDKEKALADEALKVALDRIDKEKKAEDDKYNLLKDRLDKRKVAIDDANKRELDGINERKRQEQDAHDHNVRLAQDEATAKKRAVDDVRTKENEADTDNRRLADTARDEEIARTKAKFTDPFTGLIPNVQRAKEAADLSFDGQRQAAERAATAQTKAIADTYNDPIHGLIPLAQAAERATATSFRNQAADVQASFEAQKAAVQKAYRADDGKSGILDQIDESKRLLDVQLKAQEDRFKDYKAHLTGPQGTITQTWEEATNAANAYFDQVERRRAGINSEGGAGSTYGPSPGEVPGGGSGSGSQPGAGSGAPGGGSTPGGGSGGGSGGSTPPPANVSPIDNSSRASFVRTGAPFMLEAAGGNKDLAGMMLAAAISENGAVGGGGAFGNNNFFGIKAAGAAGTGSTGSGSLMTWEAGQGAVAQNFAIYPDPVTGFAAFMKFLQNNSRYKNSLAAFARTGNAVQLFHDINGAGYATDDIWWRKVVNIEQNQVKPVVGYAQGGPIMEPTLLVGASRGPYAVAGEAGPEWVGPVSSGSSGGPGYQVIEVDMQIDGQTQQRLWIGGYRLIQRRGGLPSSFGDAA